MSYLPFPRDFDNNGNHRKLHLSRKLCIKFRLKMGDRELPVANRFIAFRVEQERFTAHRQMLARIKPVTDSSPPQSYHYLRSVNAKKKLMEQGKRLHKHSQCVIRSCLHCKLALISHPFIPSFRAKGST